MTDRLRRRVARLRPWLAPLCASLPAFAGPASDADGYLHQKVGILVYGGFRDGEPAGWEPVLDREIAWFESFLWRESDRRLFVESVVLRPGRSLERGEYRYAGPRWGYLPDLGPAIAADLGAAGWHREDFDALFLLYAPEPDRDTPLAGATYRPPEVSAIPLRPETFVDGGRRHPLHRLLVHEYLHQMALAAPEPGRLGLIDPDGRDWEECPGGRADALQVALRWSASCRAVEWRRLSPDRGAWTVR